MQRIETDGKLYKELELRVASGEASPFPDSSHDSQEATRRLSMLFFVHIVIGLARGFVLPRTSSLILAQRVLP